MPTPTPRTAPGVAAREKKMRSDSVERLRRRLNASRGEWSAIAPAADVSYKTMLRFANGGSKRPWGGFLKKLDEYFRRVDAGRPPVM